MKKIYDFSKVPEFIIFLLFSFGIFNYKDFNFFVIVGFCIFNLFILVELFKTIYYNEECIVLRILFLKKTVLFRDIRIIQNTFFKNNMEIIMKDSKFPIFFINSTFQKKKIIDLVSYMKKENPKLIVNLH